MWAPGAQICCSVPDPAHLEDGMGAGGSRIGISGVLGAVVVPPGQHL